jgi:hypothetical protein
VEKFKFSQILLVDKNATSICSKNIFTLKNLTLNTILFAAYLATIFKDLNTKESGRMQERIAVNDRCILLLWTET